MWSTTARASTWPIWSTRILSLFVRYPNTFLYRHNELYQKIWGKDSLGDVRTVQVHIHNLRGKIERTPPSPFT
ncbi:MAG: helix-turn-helix domain-containing protein [Faecalibacterium sp.]